MEITLTVTTTYRGHWGSNEGLREMMQNGRDAEVEHRAPLKVRYRKETQTLVIENEGTVLDRDALLLGHTTKADRSDLAGKWGDGLKIGMLALLRNGHNVKIRNGSEVWVPGFKKGEVFKSDVLVVKINEGRKADRRVAVEISGITPEIYADLPNRFLFLNGDIEKDRVRTSAGSLLLGDRYAGRIYVKGIFVEFIPTLKFGYDFEDADLDVDRNMIKAFDLNYNAQRVWREALLLRPQDLTQSFAGLLESNARDVEGIDEYTARYLPKEAVQAVTEVFEKVHGKDALPVRSMSESAEIGHLGRTGVVLPAPLRSVIEVIKGTSEKAKEALLKESQKLYSWHDLTPEEQKSLIMAINLIASIEPVSLADINVTDFRDEKLQGLFQNGKILLARKVLSDWRVLLETLVHEVAHKAGGDGEHGHVATIERIWSSMFMRFVPGPLAP